MTGRLAGKRALVTGAGKGIGAAIARAMRAEGAEVFASDVDMDAVNEVAGVCGAIPIRLDVSSEEDWVRFAKQLERAQGGLSILVNNAGIAVGAPLAEITLQDWRRIMAINVESMFIGCRAMEPFLDAAGSPERPSSVVLLSSLAALIGLPNQLHYSTSKSAIRGMSRTLAIEWAHNSMNIRCNSVHPGSIRTPLMEAAVGKRVQEGLFPADDPWRPLAQACPLKRVGEPEDIAHGVIYLASDEARWVTGTELVIDGGLVAI